MIKTLFYTHTREDDHDCSSRLIAEQKSWREKKDRESKSDKDEERIIFGH